MGSLSIISLLSGILLVCVVASSKSDCLRALALSGRKVRLLELLHPRQTEMLMQHFVL